MLELADDGVDVGVLVALAELLTGVEALETVGAESVRFEDEAAVLVLDSVELRVVGVVSVVVFSVTGSSLF